MNYIETLFQFWLSAPIIVALLMSVATNLLSFFVTAYLLYFFTDKLIHQYKIGSRIDSRSLKPNQIQIEMRYGFIACLVLAGTSLLIRPLVTSIWPSDFFDLIQEFVFFIAFYEIYSYSVHRLMHSRLLSRFHSVHHWSSRVTPWSAYSVHPIEAIFIGCSSPLYMLFFDLSLGTALVLHVTGIMFTTLIHSNYQFSRNKNIDIISNYNLYHQQHHELGNRHFGFINSIMDRIFRTYSAHK